MGSDGHRDSEARTGELGHERPVGWKLGGKTLTVSRSNVHTDGLGKQVPNARAIGPRAGRRPGRWAQRPLLGQAHLPQLWAPGCAPRTLAPPGWPSPAL